MRSSLWGEAGSTGELLLLLQLRGDSNLLGLSRASSQKLLLLLRGKLLWGKLLLRGKLLLGGKLLGPSLLWLEKLLWLLLLELLLLSR